MNNCLNHDFNKINKMNRINTFSTETEAPFNSPEGGKCSPPLEGLGEANAQPHPPPSPKREGAVPLSFGEGLGVRSKEKFLNKRYY